ncbi:MAG: gamma-glutamylcyclotransferase family protein [Actinoallomurus sp.]
MPTSGRSLPAPPAALFAYGTLRFPDVLVALLGRVPAHTPAVAPGWRVAALDGRVYPMLVPGEGAAGGVLISGLTAGEWRVIDAYEDDVYALERLTLADGRIGWAYLTRDHTVVLPADWSPGDFTVHHLPAFVGRLRGA